jgi:predicted transcriptional regulator
MRVDEIMTQPTQSCSPSDSLERVAQLMWEYDRGCIPVKVMARAEPSV